MQLTLDLLNSSFAVARLPHDSPIPAPLPEAEFFSVTRTSDELSVITPEGQSPVGATVEDGWRALKIAGPLDFSELGILAALATTLAETQVSIFAVSTYDTDYVLCKKESLSNAIDALRDAGHTVRV